MNSRFFFIFSMCMTVAYILFGLFIAFFKNFSDTFSPLMRYCFAGFIIAYGIFRGWRAYKITESQKQKEERSAN